MSTPLKNVIILGASGNVGTPTVSALLKAGTYTITALTRKSSSATFPPEVKVHKIDDSYPTKDLLSAFKGEDVVIDLLPPSNPKQQNSIVDAAAEAGVKRYIPSEFGSDTSNPKVVEMVPMFATKADILEYLKTKESTGMSWTAVVNGAFFDWGLRNGFLGFDLATNTATIYDDGNGKVNYTTMSTIGQSIVSILEHSTETANKFVYIQSVRATQNEILAAFEKSTGKEWTKKQRSTDEAKKAGYEKLEKGDFSGLMDIIPASIFKGEKEALYDETRGLDNKMLGLKEESLGELIEKVVKGHEV
ncbi:MAG: hypothetical protein Q9183_005511 [Haloplaca sp. 2 TL-2023]